MNSCVLLFTGGRKSRMAAALLRKQGVQIVGLHCTYPWCDDAGAAHAADRLEIELRRADLSEAQWRYATEPRRPTGPWGAPCADCAVLRLRAAGALASELRADFVATGDVVSAGTERSEADLAWCDREAGLERGALRPLSARALPVTRAEEDGLLDRTALLDLTSGSPKHLSIAARRLGMDFGDDRGASCGFAAKRLGPRFAHLRSSAREAARPSDLAILEIGRHYLDGRKRIVVAATADESERLPRLAREGDWIVSTSEDEGPCALVRGDAAAEAIEKAAALLAAMLGRRSPTAEIAISAARVGGTDRRRVAVPHPRPAGELGLTRL